MVTFAAATCGITLANIYQAPRKPGQMWVAMERID